MTWRKNVLCLIAMLPLAACVTPPRTMDNVSLARIAKDYIGVGSIDELDISRVQTIPVEGSNVFGKTQYRFFVDTARKKKFVCDVGIYGLKSDGTPWRSNEVKCDPR